MERNRPDIGDNIAAVIIVGMTLGLYKWLIGKAIELIPPPPMEINIEAQIHPATGAHSFAVRPRKDYLSPGSAITALPVVGRLNT